MRGVSPRLLYGGIAILAAAAGGGRWYAALPPAAPVVVASEIAPGALFAVTFADTKGERHALAEFQGKVVVVNFWATWCVPCREEMPAFARLHDRWRTRGVQFVGLADDDPAKVERFGRELGIPYPLWVGSESAAALSRRLGNRLGALPHTVVIDGSGRPVLQKVGPYTEAELDDKLRLITSN
jgi:thiol-disulfide isomerase/thioredoxin